MNNILIVAFITLLVCSVFVYIKIYKQMVIAKKAMAKILIKNIALEEYINKLEGNKIQSDESIHQENFIKFLSDSRDWAYQYIEEVQSGIGKFVLDIDQLIEHFDTYGDVLSTNRPDYASMKKISEAYKELKKLLPKEE